MDGGFINKADAEDVFHVEEDLVLARGVMVPSAKCNICVNV